MLLGIAFPEEIERWAFFTGSCFSRMAFSAQATTSASEAGCFRFVERMS